MKLREETIPVAYFQKEVGHEWGLQGGIEFGQVG